MKESRMVPEQIRRLQGYIPNVESLRVEEIEAIRDDAAMIAEAIRSQERILDDAGDCHREAGSAAE